MTEYDKVFWRWFGKGFCHNEARFRADAWQARKEREAKRNDH